MGKYGLNRRLLDDLDAIGVRFVESGDDGGSGSGSDRDDATGDKDDKGDDDATGGKDRDGDDDKSGSDDDGDDFDSLPERTKAEIRRLRREGKRKADDAKTARQERDAQADTLAKVTKLLKGDDADSDDPEALAKRVTDLDTENRTLKAERAAERAVQKAGGDVETVMDSRAFTDALGKLDPSDDKFADDLAELAKETVASSDRFKATPPRSGSGSGEHGGNGPKGRPKNLRDAYARRGTKNRS